MAIDPLAESYAGYSPYNYVLGNPISLIDPDGREVKNGAEEKREGAENEFNKYDQIVKNAESKYGTRKKDFNSKQQFKNFKKAKKLRRNARASLNHWTTESSNTQDMINDIKSSSPVMFNLMDNLQNEQGETVDLFIVSTDDVAGENDGANLLSFSQSAGGTVKPKSDFGVNTIEIQVANSPSGNRTTNEVIRHEFGHALINGRLTGSYYNFLSRNGHLRNSRYAGHGTNDLSGITADYFTGLRDFPMLRMRRGLGQIIHP